MNPLASLRIATVLAGVTLGAGAAQQQTFLRNVHVVDLAAGRVLRDQALAIEDERIAALGPSASLRPPAGATVVEGGGRYLLPGLFDMHVHLAEEHAEDSLFLHLANGVTSVQSMHGSPWHLALRARLARGELLGPRLFTTGPTTATLGVHQVEHAERVVREQKAAGYDAVKMYGDGTNTMPRETYLRLVATGHEIGMRIVGHAPRNLPFAIVLEARQDSIDHMEEIVYTEKSLAPVVGTYVALQFGGTRFEDHPELAADVPDFRPPLAEALAGLAQRVRAAGTHVTPTLVTFTTIQKTTDEAYFALLQRDELCYVAPTVRAAWAPDQARFRNGGWQPHLAFFARYLARNAELQLEMARVFHAAGVPLMTGTDAPFDFVVPGFALHDELALFVAAGLTPLEALRCATLVPAHFLGLEDGSGTIAVGARADLVLVERDPLQDISATRQVAGVCARGRWLAPEFLQTQLRELAQRNAAVAERLDALRAVLGSGEPTVAALTQALEEYRKGVADAHLAGWLEDRINGRGFELLRAKRLDEALTVMHLNTAAFPASANAWDSLGEVCAAKGDLAEALQSYERLLELDPDNENGRRSIDRIVERMSAADE